MLGAARALRNRSRLGQNATEHLHRCFEELLLQSPICMRQHTQLLKSPPSSTQPTPAPRLSPFMESLRPVRLPSFHAACSPPVTPNPSVLLSVPCMHFNPHSNPKRIIKHPQLPLAKCSTMDGHISTSPYRPPPSPRWSARWQPRWFRPPRFDRTCFGLCCLGCPSWASRSKRNPCPC